MNISYNWLRQYLDTKDDAQEIARLLTSIGLEVGTVETQESIRGGLRGVKVGKVVTSEMHPNSDHLHICQVDLGDGGLTQIVCGAPNVAAGQKVLVATIGTTLYQGEESLTIKKGKLRGVESLGMICAEDELGVGTSHDGIMVLPEDTPVGMDARDYFHLEDDTLIEVDITPNRNDGASHYGVARDLYAYYHAHGIDAQLHLPDVSRFKVQSEDLPIRVSVEDTAACPRYTGVSIKGVTVKESPKWLQERLQAIGLRSINNVVDVTNFVLMELGQALHAFDADTIRGQHIIVRKSKEGTPFVTLDGVERHLSKQDLMICDEEREMCMAGVFGGLNTGVTEQTRNVFLESAYFEPVGIRKTARRHGLSTDASFRYERGCDPNFTMYVLKRAALLIQEVAGGEVSMQVADVVNGTDCQAQYTEADEPFGRFEVEMNLDRVERLIGKQIGSEMAERILTGLDIRFSKKDADYRLQVPRYRVDVQRECDVAEDILRIYGYNNVEFPEKVNTSLSYSTHPDLEMLKRRLSEQLTAQGFREIMNNSLTKISYYDRGNWLDYCVRVKNPLSSDLGLMRQTLLFGGLETIARNLNRQAYDLSLYEFGNCYFFNNAKCKMQDAECEAEPIQAYSENLHLALWLTGKKSAPSWVKKSEEVSFYQLHAYVNNLLLRLGIDPKNVVLEPAFDPTKEKCCGIDECFADGLIINNRQGKSLGYMAIVSRQLLREFDIDQPVYYADLYWQNLMAMNKQYKPVIEDLPKYPSVKRDFALLVDQNIRFADLERAAMQTEKKLLRSVNLFDVYEGKNLADGKKSYALSFILQDKDDTLKDKQIERIMDRLKQTFEKEFGATLR